MSLKVPLGAELGGLTFQFFGAITTLFVVVGVWWLTGVVEKTRGFDSNRFDSSTRFRIARKAPCWVSYKTSLSLSCLLSTGIWRGLVITHPSVIYQALCSVHWIVKWWRKSMISWEGRRHLRPWPLALGRDGIFFFFPFLFVTGDWAQDFAYVCYHKSCLFAFWLGFQIVSWTFAWAGLGQ
jgi:hypothetical protein